MQRHALRAARSVYRVAARDRVVEINRECTWDARSEAGSLALSSEPAGQGSGTIRFR